MPEYAPPGGNTIEFAPAMNSNLPPEAQGPKKIERVLESSLELLKQHLILQIAVKRISSPYDFRDELNLFEGAIYGFSPSVDPLGLHRHRWPVEGL